MIALVQAGVVAASVLAGPAAAAASETLWELLRAGGQVVLIRHASTVPGTGDPPGFRLDECATQRNLSEAGREEARRLGREFRTRGIPVGRVLSSRWCRCLETGRLAFGRAEPWTALDSLYAEPDRREERTRAVRALAAERPTDGNLVLVTHQFNIRAVAELAAVAQGELVILTPLGDGTFRVAGRLRPVGAGTD